MRQGWAVACHPDPFSYPTPPHFPCLIPTFPVTPPIDLPTVLLVPDFPPRQNRQWAITCHLHEGRKVGLVGWLVGLLTCITRPVLGCSVGRCVCRCAIDHYHLTDITYLYTHPYPIMPYLPWCVWWALFPRPQTCCGSAIV